jgi:hypothetical protein
VHTRSTTRNADRVDHNRLQEGTDECSNVVGQNNAETSESSEKEKKRLYYGNS